MKLQVLVSTMHQQDYSLLEQMNIRTDAIVINQCDHYKVEKIQFKENNVVWMSFKEKGVGLSRNNALMRASGDICLMADDDMVYCNDYESIVRQAFIENPKADVILFNVPITKKNGKVVKKVKKKGRVFYHNCLKYGTVNIAFKKDAILKKNIAFSLLFGGGAKYGSGEDSLFIIDCLKKGLRIYSNPSIIANIQENESSWFTGYNEKYFHDRGALFKAISNKAAFILAIQFVIRKRNLYKNNFSFKQVMKFMTNGIKDFTRK